MTDLEKAAASFGAAMLVLGVCPKERREEMRAWKDEAYKTLMEAALATQSRQGGPVALTDDEIAARCSSLESVKRVPAMIDEDHWPAVERALLDVARLFAAPPAHPAEPFTPHPPCMTRSECRKEGLCFDQWLCGSERPVDPLRWVNPAPNAAAPGMPSPYKVVTLDDKPPQPVERVLMVRDPRVSFWRTACSYEIDGYRDEDYEYAWFVQESK